MQAACPPATILPIDEGSRVAEARRAVTEASRRLGFDDTDSGRAALVATELATNLLKHAGGGEILLCAAAPGEPDGPPTLQLVALDRGPGIPDLAACLRDGFSTAGTAGNGLGAVRRLADGFAAWSAAGRGTALLAHLFPADRQPAAGPFQCWGGLSLAYPGEEACGDSFAIHPGPRPGTLFAAMADGLGHGPSAALAGNEATRLFRTEAARPGVTPAAILDAIHAGLSHTRGAAVSVALLGDPAPGAVRVAGLGNIAGAMIAPDTGQARRLVSMAGIAGNLGARPRTREFTVENGPQALLVLHSDGVSTSWSLAEYPGLTAQPAALIAAVLLRDHARRDGFGRRSDDAAVLVARLPGAAPEGA